jgi:hypothetical protein
VTYLKLLCRFCSKFRSPAEFIHNATSGYCWHCYAWHQSALKMLATAEYPPGCQECGLDIAVLREREPGDFRMYLHPKDGIYQVLCKTCSDKYERKRLDLYGNTPYGHVQKLKGAR